MPVSGLVLILHSPVDNGAEVMRILEADHRFTCGLPVGNRLPVVLEAEDDETARRTHDWLTTLPGVAGVQVAFVGFDHAACADVASTRELPEGEPASASARPARP